MDGEILLPLKVGQETQQFLFAAVQSRVLFADAVYGLGVGVVSDKRDWQRIPGQVKRSLYVHHSADFADGRI